MNSTEQSIYHVTMKGVINTLTPSNVYTVVLVVNYGISNTTVLEIPYFTTKTICVWELKVRSHMCGADAGRSGWKIGLNTNHNMRSHIRGRGAGAKSAPQQIGPTPNIPHPLQNPAPQTIFVLKKWQIRQHPLCVCVNLSAVAEWECQNPPASTPQPLRACVNEA